MLIGIVGRKGSGKTSAANLLVKEHGFKKMAFSDPLKEIVSELFGVGYVNFTDEYLKTKEIPHMPGWTPRRLMQYFGTEVVRNLYYNAWIDIMERRIKRETNQDIVVDDVRFINEAELIKKLGGVLIGVEVEGEDKSDLHDSERFVEQVQNEYCMFHYCAPKGLLKLHTWMDQTLGIIKNSPAE